MPESKPLILVVEDEPTIADTVVYALQTEGLDTEWVTHGGEAIAIARARGPALVLLDIGLPDINGFDVFREIRRDSAVPIVFLTARSSEVDEVLALELGAEDYITKPFSPRVLAARVRARLRPAAATTAAAPARLVLDRNARVVRLDGRDLRLTRYEYGVLEVLMQHPHRPYSRDQLLELVWSDHVDSYDRTVDTHVKTIRQKIRAIAPNLDPIRTRRGTGYSYEP